MSSDLSAEVTAIATAVLATFAFITAILAGLAYRKQSREVHDQGEMLKLESEELAEQRKLNAEQAKVLELQASDLRESLEERKREAAERYRAQAAQVFIGAEMVDPHRGFWPVVVNGSEFPAYDVQVWGFSAEYSVLSDPHDLATVLPGDRATVERGGGSAQEAIQRVVLTFRDAAGVCWVRMPDGTLSEQTRDTAQKSVLAALGALLPEQFGHKDQEQPDIPGE